MFAYRAVEREKASGAAHAGGKDRASDSSSEGNSLCGEENGATPDDASTVSGGTVRSRPESSDGKKTPVRKADGKALPRQTDEGETGERGEASVDGKEDDGSEAGGCGAAADVWVRAHLGLGPRRVGKLVPESGDPSGDVMVAWALETWNGVPCAFRKLCFW
ncbi:hypothetical protein HU200_047493 [Digitaria exilis]|uniref:Uncharacterized protein n=1 Tax=Digitaria exilis TaxID=1010633 RepID=A0A835B2R6_9POAL|nr:hypothetical protein HU200_047493 [Digitaria exilis]